MMPEVKEGYFANIKNYPPNELFAIVSRKYPWFVKRLYKHYVELAPSKELLKDWKEANISWEEYEKRFRLEMQNAESQTIIDDLAWASQYDTFRLLCWEKEPPCHRFILIDLINESLNEHNKIYEDESKGGGTR